MGTVVYTEKTCEGLSKEVFGGDSSFWNIGFGKSSSCFNKDRIDKINGMR